MALTIIVDGYNLIGSHRGLTGNLERKRKDLIEKLQLYHERKGYPITLVFDGWRSGWTYEMEETIGSLTVIYSQRGEKADQVIQRLAEEMGSQCLVVSSDREVQSAAEGSGAVAIYAGEFNAKLRQMDRESPGEFSLVAYHQPGERSAQSKKGNPRRLSKSERKRRERLKKL